jgi:small-conductance mechanosensitive channel
MLTLAAERTPGVRQDPKPFVLQRALADFYPEYELIVHIDSPEQRYRVLSELHAQIQDVFNEYGVQIMSPNFKMQPETGLGPEGAVVHRPRRPVRRGPAGHDLAARVVPGRQGC